MLNGPRPTEADRASGPEGPGDTDLVARARAGDLEAFDLLVTRHRRAAYRIAWRMTGRHQDADDLSQEAFLRAWKGLRTFRGESSFATWLTRIVMNLASSGRLARRPLVPFEESAPSKSSAPFEGTEDAANGAGPSADDRVLREEIRSAVGGLPPRQRRVLVLKVYEGWTFAEIGREMRIAVGTAKATFFQAVQILRGRLNIGPGPGTAPRAKPAGREAGEKEVAVR